MLIIKNLSKIYKTERGEIQALENVSLEISSGKFVVIIGRSGSGKSSLLSALGGLNRPSYGTVTINGIDIWSLSSSQRTAFRNKHIGFVFQIPRLLPTLRAIDNVALPALLQPNIDLEAVYGKAESLLQQVGLREYLDAYPSEMSGGQQRRVAIARALINSPSLLLADEPTNDLDAATEIEIITLLRSLTQEAGHTFMLITHVLSLAEQADQVFTLDQGILVTSNQQNQEQGKTILFFDLYSLPKKADLTNFPFQSKSELSPELPLSSSSEATETATIRWGTSIFWLRNRLFLLIFPFLVMFGIIDAGVSIYQRRILEARKQTKLRLEQSAYSYLYIDVKNVEYNMDGKSYKVTLSMQNLNPQQLMYVLVMPIQIFVQAGMVWKEVFSLSLNGEGTQMIQLAAQQQEFQANFTPNLDHWTELIPGYMHVCFSIDMLISLRSQPKDDIAERRDRYFVYLKPYNVDDQTILRQNNFLGKPPVYIPMPAH